MKDVDGEARRYNAALLKEVGVLEDVEQIGTYMWHGGAHHVGFDVHDAVETPQVIAPGMVFCVDIGIYHEEWGIGFRLEDNCLVKEDGCASTRFCDAIAMFEEGRLVEYGTHEELLARKGKYAEMFRVQAQYYR